MLIQGLLACALAAGLLPQEPTPGERALAEVPLPEDRDAGPTLPLTLDEALRLGAQFNTTLRADELLPLEAAQDVRGARAIFEPELFASAAAASSKDPTRNIFQPEISSEMYSATFGVRQLVPSGGLFDLAFSPAKLRHSAALPGFPPRQFTSDFTATYTQPLLRGAWTDYTLRDVHIREAVRAAALHRHARVIQDTLIDVVEAYWNLVFARGNYRVSFLALEQAQRQLERTNRRIEVGELAPLDRVADEAEVARRREELVTAENDIRDREDDLRRLLFDDRDGEVWRRRLEPVTPIGDVVAPGELDWRDPARTAGRLRPDLRARRADVAVAEIQLMAAERDVLPRLDLVGSYTTDSVAPEFSQAWDDTVGFAFADWSIRLELSVPLGNNAARAGRDRARLELERARRVLYGAELDVQNEVRDAVRRVGTLAESVQRGRESARLATTNLDRESARREAGTSTTFEVQQRNQELQEARTRLLRNALDYRIAEANLLYVQGTLGVPPEQEEPEKR